MLYRLRLYLGLGPAEAYGQPPAPSSRAKRIIGFARRALEMVLIVAAVVTDSWTWRLVFLIALVGVAVLYVWPASATTEVGAPGRRD